MENEIVKKGNGSKVFIILLILIIIGLVSYIVYDKVLINKKCDTKEIKENKEKANKKDEIKYLDIYSDEIQELYNNVQSKDNCMSTTKSLYEKGNITLDSFKEKAFYLAIELFGNEKGEIIDGYYQMNKSFTYDEVNNKAKLIFGDSFNVEDKEYKLCGYKYDSKTKTYTPADEAACGCTSGPGGPMNFVYKAIQKDDKTIEIYESVIYEEFDEKLGTGYYYKDPLFNDRINNCFGEVGDIDCIKGSTKYKFTFTKEKNNYIFTKVEKDI